MMQSEHKALWHARCLIKTTKRKEHRYAEIKNCLC